MASSRSHRRPAALLMALVCVALTQAGPAHGQDADGVTWSDVPK